MLDRLFGGSTGKGKEIEICVNYIDQDEALRRFLSSLPSDRYDLAKNPGMIQTVNDAVSRFPILTRDSAELGKPEPGTSSVIYQAGKKK